MTLIAACPRCDSPLELPAGGDADVLMRCPVCEAEFAKSVASVRELPRARLVERAATSAQESAPAARSETVETAAALPLRISPRRRREPAVVKTLVGIVGGGLLGILIGAYGLLWLLGPDGDVMGLAKWLPDFVLPPRMR